MTHEQREIYLLLLMIGREEEASRLKEKWENETKEEG